MGNDFTNDLLYFGQYYKEYKRLMAYWTAVLTIPIFDLQYEDLVRDSENMIKELVAFCDLPWERGMPQFRRKPARRSYTEQLASQAGTL